MQEKKQIFVHFVHNSCNRFSHSDNGQPLNYRGFHIISFSEKDVVWTFTIPPKKWLTELFFQEEQLNDVEQICPSFGAFAAVAGNGHVITWGDYDFGADSWLLGGVKTWRNETTQISIENHPGRRCFSCFFLFFFEGGWFLFWVWILDDFFETLLLLADLVLLFLTGTNTYRSYSKSPHSMLILFHILVVSSFDSWHHIPVGDP